MVSNGATTPAGDGGATRRNVLKGATAAVGAFIALEAIGGVSLAAGASPKTTALSNGVNLSRSDAVHWLFNLRSHLLAGPQTSWTL